MSKKKSFFVGPAKTVSIEKQNNPAPSKPSKRVQRRPRSDPVADAQSIYLKNVESHREHFRKFLRGSLALLDKDIVETVVKEFDSHCACEDRVVESASHYLATATRNRIFPELRHFQLIVDASEATCTNECAEAITMQREMTISQNRTNDLTAIDMPPDKGGIHPGSSVDLTLLGGVNDLLSWGENFRDVLVTAYRNGESSEPTSTLLGATLNSKSSSNRPSTAPLRRRQPPVGGGFISSLYNGLNDAQHRNIFKTLSPSIGRPSSAKSTRKLKSNAATKGRGDIDKPETRRLLRQTLGSYYSHDTTNTANLSSILTSSASGYNNGVRHAMPSVRRTQQFSNPNNVSRQRAMQRAKNNIDLANYNAFHARPMLRGAITFEGPRRRQIPRASSTSTIEMQKRSLMRGLNDSFGEEDVKQIVHIPSDSGSEVERKNGRKPQNHKKGNKKKSNNSNSSFKITKSLRAAKSRHGKKASRTISKNRNSVITGWDDQEI
jgi:hypothetical protein